MTTYNDLVGKQVFARLRDDDHPEWQLCKVLKIIRSGIKLQSQLTRESFIVANEDVRSDLRLRDAFIPWEHEQKLYNGNSLFS